MKKYVLLLLIALVLLAAWWLFVRSSAPLEVPFAKVKRETLISTLSTNGKVQPFEWTAVRAGRAGPVNQVRVQEGDQVRAGALLAQLDSSDARASLASAEARIKEARASLEVLEKGGSSAQLAQIESDLAQARMELDNAKRDHAALERLAQKGAATREQVQEASERIETAHLKTETLEKKRATLVSPADKTAAQAKLDQAQADADLARHNIQEADIRAPLAGMVYDLAVRPGAYVNPGDLLAKIGQIEKVRVHVYVDEPELGRVSKGLPVTITWDALPNRQWKGEVERMPTQIVPLGSRQVGEVICIIDNPGKDLLPGTNVNAEVRSAVAQNALTIPRGALRRQASEDGVFVLEGDRIVWRKITIGISSTSRTQVTAGLAEGDSVALPTEQTLAAGMEVRPVYPG